MHGTDTSRLYDYLLRLPEHDNRHHFYVAILTDFVSIVLKSYGFLQKHWLPWTPDIVVTYIDNGLIAGMPFCTNLPVMMTKFQTMAYCLITGSDQILPFFLAEFTVQAQKTVVNNLQ